MWCKISPQKQAEQLAQRMQMGLSEKDFLALALARAVEMGTLNKEPYEYSRDIIGICLPVGSLPWLSSVLYLKGAWARRGRLPIRARQAPIGPDSPYWALLGSLPRLCPSWDHG